VDDPAEVWVLEDACRHGTPPFPSPTLASSRALLACRPFSSLTPPRLCVACARSPVQDGQLRELVRRRHACGGVGLDGVAAPQTPAVVMPRAPGAPRVCEWAAALAKSSIRAYADAGGGGVQCGVGLWGLWHVCPGDRVTGGAVLARR
jgi:hypothetical protein